MKRQFGMLGTRGEEISLTRATTATNEVNGTVWNVPAGVPRVTTQGTLIERASTNYVLNNRTHPKTTEATASITATQACVGWHEGTGTMTIANGTATTTGLSCTAVSPGTLCTFTVTVGGTMAITTSAGTVTKAQIECPGSTKTSEIPTAGTSVARNADVATVPTPAGLSPSRWCVEVVATPFGGRAWNALANAVPWAIGTSSTANWAQAVARTTSSRFQWRGADNLDAIYDVNSTWTTAGPGYRVSFSNSAGIARILRDGATQSAAFSGTGSGVFGSFPATVYLGNSSTGSFPFDGYLRDFRIYRSPTCR
jgi:hypothetical protein